MDTRLLSGANADDLAVQGVAHRVGLRVLEGHRGHQQVAQRLLRHLWRTQRSVTGPCTAAVTLNRPSPQARSIKPEQKRGYRLVHW